MDAVKTAEAPQAIGPYSQAIAVDGWVFASGQIGLDPQTGELPAGGVAEQAHQVMKNLLAVLKAGGCDQSHLVKVQIFLKSMDDFQIVNEVYASYLSEPYPARATVEVSRLPKDVLVEIDAVAKKS